MSLFDQINKDIKAAMLAKEKEKLEALRAVKTAFTLEKTKTSDGNISDDVYLKIIQKLVKQRLDSADVYKGNGREELADKELKEADFIKVYLPAQLSDEELTVEVKKIIETVGATSMQDMGKVMGMASKQLSGKSDGKTISNKVKELLS